MAIANINIADFIKEGSNITFTTSDEGRIITIAASGGGGGTPGGSDTHVQYNDGGSFGGEAAFTYNKTTNRLNADYVAVLDDAYDATTWNGNLDVPTKNAVRDKIESLGGGISGSGTSGYVTYWTGASAISGESNLFWDATNDRLGIKTSSPEVPLDVVGNTLGTNTAQFGTIGIQSYAVNNSWFGDNVYFDNVSGFRRRQAGYGTLFYFYGSEGQFRMGSTSTAGSLITNGLSGVGLVVMKFNVDKTFAIGDMSGSPGVYTGATFIHYGSTGNVFIGSSPSDGGFKLDVNGTGRFQSSLTVAGNLTNNRNILAGNLAIQSYDNQNGWYGQNVFFDGSGFKRITSGYTIQAYFYGSEFQLRMGSSSTAGSSVTNGSSGQGLVTFKSNIDKTFAIGDISANTGNYTGATFIHFGSTGNVFIGSSPADNGFKLEVNGTTRLLDNITIADAKNIILNTTTGTKIGTATTQKIGFFNSTPVVQPSAYTQTYSTATKTHANLTSSDLSGITSSTTGSALAEPSASYTQSEMQQNFRRIQDQYNALKADLTNLKQVVNQVIDDHQSLGLLG